MEIPKTGDYKVIQETYPEGPVFDQAYRFDGKGWVFADPLLDSEAEFHLSMNTHDQRIINGQTTTKEELESARNGRSYRDQQFLEEIRAQGLPGGLGRMSDFFDPNEKD